MIPSDVRDKSSEELTKLVVELEEEIFRLRFRRNAGQLKQTANVSKARRDLARVKTVVRERESAGAKGGA